MENISISKLTPLMEKKSTIKEGPKCGICDKVVKFSVVELPCNHFFCPECIKKKLKSQLSERKEEVACPTCFKLIEDDILEEIFDKEILKKYRKTKCDVCKESKGKILPCGHTFCESDMKKLVRECFKKEGLNAVTCSLCEKPRDIDGEDIQKIVDEKWLQEYYLRCKNCKKLKPIVTLTDLRRCGHKMCKDCFKLCETEKKCLKCNKRLKRKSGEIEKKCKFCRKFLPEVLELDCKHRICKECLEKYLEKTISLEIPILCCPKFDCKEIISEEKIRGFLEDETCKNYRNFIKKIKKRGKVSEDIIKEEETKSKSGGFQKETPPKNQRDFYDGANLRKIQSDSIGKIKESEEKFKKNKSEGIETKRQKDDDQEKDDFMNIKNKKTNKTEEETQFFQKNGKKMEKDFEAEEDYFFKTNKIEAAGRIEKNNDWKDNSNKRKSEEIGQKYDYGSNNNNSKNFENSKNEDDLFETTILSKKPSSKMQTSDQPSCCVCQRAQFKNVTDITILECNHVICLVCLNDHIARSLEKFHDFEPNIKCPFKNCNKLLDMGILKNFVRYDINDKLEKRQNLKKRSDEWVLCEKCKKGVNPDEILTMTCDHKCCSHFFKETYGSKIRRYEFKDLICFKCSQELEYLILEANLPKEIFQSYESYLVRNAEKQIYNEDWKKEKESRSNYKDITCPSCKVVNSVDPKSREFRCNGCYKYFCSNENCLGSNGHYAKTCEEYKIWLENTIFCPKCNRETSTYYMDERFKYCYWHSKIYFCITCKHGVENTKLHKCEGS